MEEIFKKKNWAVVLEKNKTPHYEGANEGQEETNKNELFSGIINHHANHRDNNQENSNLQNSSNVHSSLAFPSHIMSNKNAADQHEETKKYEDGKKTLFSSHIFASNLDLNFNIQSPKPKEIRDNTTPTINPLVEIWPEIEGIKYPITTAATINFPKSSTNFENSAICSGVNFDIFNSSGEVDFCNSLSGINGYPQLNYTTSLTAEHIENLLVHLSDESVIPQEKRLATRLMDKRSKLAQFIDKHIIHPLQPSAEKWGRRITLIYD